MRSYLKVAGMFVAVGLIVAAGIGVVYAQDATPQPPEGEAEGSFWGRGPRFGFHGPMPIDREAVHEALAEALGITVDALEDALAEGETLSSLAQEYEVDFAELQAVMEAAHEEALAQAVAEGVITQAQADQIRERKGPGFMGMRGGFGPREGLGPFPLDREAVHEALAEALGITVDALEDALAEGETLSSLAQEYEVDFAELQAVMEEFHAEALAQAVADGELTQAQADQILERKGARPGFGMGRGPGFCHGPALP